MIKLVIEELRTALIATLTLAVLLCGIYPLAVWTAAQLFFDHEANGSLVTRKGVIVGSSLLAQRCSSSLVPDHLRCFRYAGNAARVIAIANVSTNRERNRNRSRIGSFPCV